jgi:SfnB family sulfur acquisition oxidoreductase
VSASQLLPHRCANAAATADGGAATADGEAQASSFAPRRPEIAAHVIRDDDEAIRIAHRLAENFAQEASLRDRERRLPRKELDEFSQSGLWGINVPRAYGGAGVSYVTVAEVIKIISAADPSIGQIPQNHLAVLDLIRMSAAEDQKRFFFAEALRGVRFGNAFAESGSKTASDFQTRIARGADGFVLNGRKFYCSGALLAHLVPVAAVDESGKFFLPIVERDAPGLTIIDDWSSFGQRTTASGTVLLENVAVPASHVVPAHRAYDQPTANGPVCQIIQAAVDAGIAKAAIADTIDFVRNHTRPWIDSGQDHGYEDVHSIAQVGDLQIRLHAAEALLERSGRFVDAAIARPDEDSVAAASIAVAEAKALTTEIAILATNRLFELAGTRSTLGVHNLDRHWRNARTHTLHDPVRWKYHAVGNYYLNKVKPPRHAWI